jgi:hypothetical protein
MLMAAPEARVADAVAGGLGRLDLSAWAQAVSTNKEAMLAKKRVDRRFM